MFKTIVAGLVIFSSLMPVSAIYAEDGSKAVAMFYIERNKNKNQVHYTIDLTMDCKIKGDNPIDGFWQELELGPKVQNALTRFDKMAYGVKNQKVIKNKVEFNLKAIDDKKIKAIVSKKDGKCTVESLMEINKKWTVLKRVYVFAKKGFLMPKVQYIDLFGVYEKKDVSERIKVDQ